MSGRGDLVAQRLEQRGSAGGYHKFGTLLASRKAKARPMPLEGPGEKDPRALQFDSAGRAPCHAGSSDCEASTVILIS